MKGSEYTNRYGKFRNIKNLSLKQLENDANSIICYLKTATRPPVFLSVTDEIEKTKILRIINNEIKLREKEKNLLSKEVLNNSNENSFKNIIL